MNTTINVVYITDSNYVYPTKISLCSLAANSSPTSFYNVYIIAVNLNDHQIQLFKSLSSEHFKIFVLCETNRRFDFIQAEHAHVSKAALLKFELPQILSDCEKVIYIDGDTLILDDLCILFRQDLKDNYVAAVSDMYIVKKLSRNRIFQHENYFNSGMMLINLDLWRAHNISKKLIQNKLQEKEHLFMDQDALNSVLGEKTLYLSPKYNFLSVISEEFNCNEIADFYAESSEKILQYKSCPVIMHLANIQSKPWKNFNSIAYPEWIKYLDSETLGWCLQNYLYSLEQKSQTLESRIHELEGTICHLNDSINLLHQTINFFQHRTLYGFVHWIWINYIKRR